MIQTDGAPTIANHGAQGGGGTTVGPRPTASQRIREARILRTWASVCSAYPDAALVVQVRETARAARVRQEDVAEALEMIAPSDLAPSDPNRWNLH